MMTSANHDASLPAVPSSITHTLASGMMTCLLAYAGACAPATGQPAAGGKLTEFVDWTAAAEEYYADRLEEIDERFTANFQVAEPTVQTSPVLQATAEVFFTDGAGEGAMVISQGNTTVLPDPETGIVEQVTQLVADGVTRTLTQTLSVADGTLTIVATLEIQGAGPDTTTLHGGWTYSPNEGIQVGPGTDSGFHAAVAEMLHVSGGDDAAPGRHLTMVLLGNMAATGTNYVLDALDSPGP